MNYNCRVEIERVNGKFVVQFEISNYGRARRSRHSAETMGDVLAIVAKAHDDGLAEIEAFLRPAQAVAEPASQDVHEVDGFYHVAQCKGDCGAIAGCATQWQADEVSKMTAGRKPPPPAFERVGGNDPIPYLGAPTPPAPKIDGRSKEARAAKRRFAAA